MNCAVFAPDVRYKHGFPTQIHPEPTLSMRDYFATFALAGLLVEGNRTASWAATRAYELADAMLEARERPDSTL